MKFDELPEFKKECTRLGKKYKSLPGDLLQFKSVVAVVPLGNSKHFSVVTDTGTVRVIKARFFYRYLKGSSLRIVYAYLEKDRRIEFIEIYYKGNKENESRDRIERYLKRRR